MQKQKLHSVYEVGEKYGTEYANALANFLNSDTRLEETLNTAHREAFKEAQTPPTHRRINQLKENGAELSNIKGSVDRWDLMERAKKHEAHETETRERRAKRFSERHGL